MTSQTTVKAYDEAEVCALMRDAALVADVLGTGDFVRRYRQPPVIEIEMWRDGGEQAVAVKLPFFAETVLEADRRGQDLTVRRFRPGAWQPFLKRLAHEARAEQVELEMAAEADAAAAFQPINDAELFADAPTTPVSQAAPKHEPSDADQLVALIRRIVKNGAGR